MRGWPLLLALACQPVTEPSGTPFARTPVTDAAAQVAISCGDAHQLRQVRSYLELRLFLAPDLGLVEGLYRADYGRDGRVWVPAPLQDEPRVWAHAFLHQLYDLPGLSQASHPSVFAACGLLDL